MFVAKSPFERLRERLHGVPPGAAPIDLTVGSPKHAPPRFIADVIAEHAASFRDYPPIAGTPTLRAAITDYLARRYHVGDLLAEHGDILPLNGSREGLFLAAVSARDLLQKPDPTVLFANPFYQVYPGSAQAIGARPVPVSASGSVVPDFAAVDEADLRSAIAFYVAAPSNPAGLCASTADWHALFDVAEHHNFFIFADECYAEIYREASGPPVGALEAAKERPDALKRLVVFHSLSKRSNLAGLRAGFAAGGREAMNAMRDFRNQVGPQVPTPLQEAAAVVYGDDAHVAENRRLYDEKYAIADKILGPQFGKVSTPAGFFLWLPVAGDDVEATVDLWQRVGVRGVPGSYLALTPTGQQNPGRGFVRLALVADASATREALTRIVGAGALEPCRERVALGS
ncbi:MAG: aminotransferase class I/II-fold pyridoxal phosphate-dependent enzyme [Pseudomonadota bacterium]